MTMIDNSHEAELLVKDEQFNRCYEIFLNIYEPITLGSTEKRAEFEF